MTQPFDPTNYSFGFTAASLRPELVGIMAEKFAELGSWEETKAAILETNALQCRSAASSNRLERELRPRLQTLTPGQLDLLNRTTSEGRVALSWLAAVKRHAFLFDFVAEVLRSKLDLHDPILRASDYERFIEDKAVSHPEVSKLTESTLKKIRRTLLTMLREIGILHKGEDLGEFRRPAIPPEVEDSIREDRPDWLAAFLVPEDQIRSMNPFPG
jgi:hypothetical protein